MINQELARKAEKEAKKICWEIGQPEGLWELCLLEAYDRLMPAPEPEEFPPGTPR